MPDAEAGAPDTLDQRAFIAELSRQLIAKAAEVRHAIIDLAAQRDAAPIGGCLSLVDLACALYYQFLQLDLDTPDAPNRDRVILSKAHALLALEPILAELGCAAGAPGATGLDAVATLPGTGLGLAAGRALAGQLAGRNWRVYCLMGDGELADGAVWEAAQFAAHYQLGNLVVLLDRNGLTAAGPTMQVVDPEPVAGKWFNAGWEVIEIHGNKMEHVAWALETLPPPSEPTPFCIMAATASGAGVDFMTDQATWHQGVVTAEVATRAHAAIDAYTAAAVREVKG